jgi:N6-L-threonylcarbamoyladenine synthase
MLNTLGEEGPDQYSFSFSGLKTALLRAVKQSPDLERDRADLARGFQDAVIDVLVEKAATAVTTYGSPALALGGGVACNQALRLAAERRLAGTARVVTASNRFNTDNAAMIGAASLFRLGLGERSGAELEPRADLPLPDLATTHDFSGIAR